jgi:hypothetical protein
MPSFVDVDNIGRARDATAHLISSGRRTVATITGPQDMGAGVARLAGYRDAVERAGWVFDTTLVRHGDFSEESGAHAMRELLAAHPAIDAVFAASDPMALGALRVLRDTGRTVPGDVAIVGFDDSVLARQTDPTLTSVHQPVEEMGRAMAALLHDRIRGVESAAPHGLAENVNMTDALTELGAKQGWLMEKLLGHEREGFIWQKLHAPRSYDFKKTENKGYNERLRMPQFPFDEDDIEAVMTFVLGLVSEPPADQYLASYKDNPRERAIIGGTKMVEQFNCGGCHQLDFQRWDVAFKPGELGADPSEPSDYSFELPHFTPDEIRKSKQEDRSGRLHGQLYGQPLVNDKGQPATQSENEEGDEFEGGGLGVRFVLWHDTLLNGKPWLIGSKMPLVPDNRVTKQYPGRGGDLGQWIYSVVVADERKVNRNAKAEEAWGWLPPPLIGEGKKVQTKWLHDFLLEPYAIRPAVVLRMPKFNMSSPEASQLVNFFAARDDAPAPYEFDARTSSDYLTTAEMQHHNRLSDALKVVTSNDYCVKCHFVGDFKPQGGEKTLGPQLDRVSERMRPDYVEQWIGNPKRKLPYTGMPQNIPPPPAKPISQSLFPGDNLQQLDGVVDLLMNWDRFAKEKFTVAPLVKPAAPATTPPSSD